MTNRAAIYLRVQTHDSEDISAEDQVAACRALIEGNDWEPVETYVDDGTHVGTHHPRPAFDRLVADAEAGVFDTVVCFRLNRLERNLGDTNRLRTAGVNILSAIER